MPDEPVELESAAHAAAEVFVEMHQQLESRRVAPDLSASALRERFRGELNGTLAGSPLISVLQSGFGSLFRSDDLSPSIFSS